METLIAQLIPDKQKTINILNSISSTLPSIASTLTSQQWSHLLDRTSNILTVKFFVKAVAQYRKIMEQTILHPSGQSVLIKKGSEKYLLCLMKMDDDDQAMNMIIKTLFSVSEVASVSSVWIRIGWNKIWPFIVNVIKSSPNRNIDKISWLKFALYQFDLWNGKKKLVADQVVEMVLEIWKNDVSFASVPLLIEWITDVFKYWMAEDRSKAKHYCEETVNWMLQFVQRVGCASQALDLLSLLVNLVDEKDRIVDVLSDSMLRYRFLLPEGLDESLELKEAYLFDTIDSKEIQIRINLIKIFRSCLGTRGGKKRKRFSYEDQFRDLFSQNERIRMFIYQLGIDWSWLPKGNSSWSLYVSHHEKRDYLSESDDTLLLVCTPVNLLMKQVSPLKAKCMGYEDILNIEFDFKKMSSKECEEWIGVFEYHMKRNTRIPPNPCNNTFFSLLLRLLSHDPPLLSELHPHEDLILQKACKWKGFFVTPNYGWMHPEMYYRGVFLFDTGFEEWLDAMMQDATLEFSNSFFQHVLDLCIARQQIPEQFLSWLLKLSDKGIVSSDTLCLAAQLDSSFIPRVDSWRHRVQLGYSCSTIQREEDLLANCLISLKTFETDPAQSTIQVCLNARSLSDYYVDLLLENVPMDATWWKENGQLVIFPFLEKHSVDEFPMNIFDISKYSYYSVALFYYGIETRDTFDVTAMAVALDRARTMRLTDTVLLSLLLLLSPINEFMLSPQDINKALRNFNPPCNYTLAKILGAILKTWSECRSDGRFPFIINTLHDWFPGFFATGFAIRLLSFFCLERSFNFPWLQSGCALDIACLSTVRGKEFELSRKDAEWINANCPMNIKQVIEKNHELSMSYQTMPIAGSVHETIVNRIVHHELFTLDTLQCSLKCLSKLVPIPMMSPGNLLLEIIPLSSGQRMIDPGVNQWDGHVITAETVALAIDHYFPQVSVLSSIKSFQEFMIPIIVHHFSYPWTESQFLHSFPEHMIWQCWHYSVYQPLTGDKKLNIFPGGRDIIERLLPMHGYEPWMVLEWMQDDDHVNYLSQCISVLDDVQDWQCALPIKPTILGCVEHLQRQKRYLDLVLLQGYPSVEKQVSFIPSFSSKEQMLTQIKQQLDCNQLFGVAELLNSVQPSNEHEASLVTILECRFFVLLDPFFAVEYMKNILAKPCSGYLKSSLNVMLGQCICENQLEPFGCVYDLYFKSAIEMIKRDKSGINGDIGCIDIDKCYIDDINIDASHSAFLYRSIAECGFNECKSIASSHIFHAANISLKQKECHALEQASKQVVGADKKQLERTSASARVQYKAERADYEQLLSRMNNVRSNTVECYLLSLCIEQDTRAVLRVCDLWLGSPSLDALMNRYLALIPSSVFAMLFYQLAARFVHEDRPTLSSLIKRMATDQPHKCMLALISLKNTERENRINEWFSRLIGEISRESAVFRDYEHLAQCYMRTAIARVSDSKGAGDQIESTLMSVRNPNIPVPTQSNETVFIHSFSSKVTLMSGINMPRLITCIGTDGKKYRQLAKANDDVRQDAVMEQLFSIINSFTPKPLTIRTYRIIPLSLCCGLIEFIDNTIPLGNVLVPAHQRYRPTDWTPKHCRELMRKEFDKIKIFQKIKSNFKPVMHWVLLEQQENPLKWFHARQRYINSVAMSSMLGYVVGLGDRHCHNKLLDCSTSELIDIDLNLIFEHGKLLNVPEMVPFRLTRDLCAGMGIGGLAGPFTRTCEKILTTLRNNKETIITVLNVFKHDPLYRWTISPRILLKYQQLIQPQESTVSEAERVIKRVEMKLNGLEQGSAFSVPGQVRRLIQVATDDENLANMFPGWQSWM